MLCSPMNAESYQKKKKKKANTVNPSWRISQEALLSQRATLSDQSDLWAGFSFVDMYHCLMEETNVTGEGTAGQSKLFSSERLS